MRETPATLTAEAERLALLPCPWCGGPATFESTERERWSVGCDDADGDCYGYQSLTDFSRKVEAAAAWNRRAPPSPEVTAPSMSREDEVLAWLEGVYRETGGPTPALRAAKAAYDAAMGTRLASPDAGEVARAAARDDPDDVLEVAECLADLHPGYEAIGMLRRYAAALAPARPEGGRSHEPRVQRGHA